MTQVNLFINDIKKSLIESEITKEGDRAIDEAIIKVPPSVDVNVNDKIIIILHPLIKREKQRNQNPNITPNKTH